MHLLVIVGKIVLAIDIDIISITHLVFNNQSTSQPHTEFLRNYYTILLILILMLTVGFIQIYAKTFNTLNVNMSFYFWNQPQCINSGNNRSANAKSNVKFRIV